MKKIVVVLMSMLAMHTGFIFGINAEIYNMNFLQTLTVNA